MTRSVNGFSRSARVVPFDDRIGHGVWHIGCEGRRHETTDHITLILIVLAFLLGFPLSAASQETQRVSRTTLARMDVLSRARLFEATIEKAARSEGVDPLILWTIAYNETRFRPWLTSPKNAQGMMQFMPATAARFGLSRIRTNRPHRYMRQRSM